MVKNTFWNEASRCGAIVGLIGVLFSLVGMLVPAISFVANLANFVVTIYLLFYFTRRRAQRFANEGYTYTQCLGFIVAIGIFAGIISGAYQIVASNFLCPEKFEESLNATIEIFQQSGVYNNEMMDQMSKMMRSYIFSPIPVLISNIFGNMLVFGFYGLFISIGTKCEPNIFDSNYENEEDE